MECLIHHSANISYMSRNSLPYGEWQHIESSGNVKDLETNKDKFELTHLFHWLQLVVNFKLIWD